MILQCDLEMANRCHRPTDQSLEELRQLRRKLGYHVENLREWTKAGGAIDPVWTRNLQVLQRDLHRTQCRAAQRIFTSAQESSTRCLGAYIVHRTQRARSRPGEQQQQQQQQAGTDESERSRRQLAELVACNRVGSFQRFGEEDIAFVCDFCDGHVVWQDLEKMPNTRTWQNAERPPPSAGALSSNSLWQATGRALSTSNEKQVIFAPIAVANHCAPPLNEWRATLLCPFCEDEALQPQDADDDGEAWKPEHDFEDLEAFQEHLEWQHGGSAAGAEGKSNDGCSIM